MQTGNSYAAFIMTYQRVEILSETIEKLLAQTLPPSKILIVDNDPQNSAAQVINKFGNTNISYHTVGYNSGPAGAAYWGLKMLFEEGWDWVLWMDDNDPPQFTDTLEKIFQIPLQYDAPEKIGMIGAVGVKFSLSKAKTIRIPDDELKGIIEVDNIAGNMLPIVHRRVFEKGILPDINLFFGFEELDFSLAVIRAGFKVLVSGEELYRYRKNAGRLNFSRKLYQVKNIQKLWREYYSMRNVVYILKYKEKVFAAVAALWLKAIGKSIIGFRYGWKYGYTNLKYLLGGFKDGWFGKMGQKLFS